MTAALVAAALLAAPALAQTVPTPREAPPPKWGPHIDFEGKAGSKRNIGEADVFVPLWQNADTLVFGNVKTRLDDDNSHEGNFGAGVRHMLDSGWNVGGYGYFDRRKTEHNNYFNQVTLGAEALSADWDFRANVYLPQGRRSKNADALNTAEISGTSVIFRGGEERSMRGVDGEIGWRVPVFDLDAGRALRIYGGAYRFYADGVDPVQGPRGRAELTFDEVPGLWAGSRLTLGAEAQHDGPRGGQVFAVARLRIPLQVFGETRAKLTPLERRMTNPVVRDVDVVSQAGAFGAPETATTASGSTLMVVASDSSGNGSLTDELTTAGANSTVILSGTINTTQFSQIQAGQTVMGSGTLTVRSPSGRTATLTTPTATLSTTGGGASIASGVGNNWTVTGLTIINSNANGATAISSNGETGVTISNNTIRVTTSTNEAIGIDLSAGGSATVTGNTVTVETGAGQTATALRIAGNGIATVSGNTLSAFGGTTNHHTNLQTVTINTGSTGNTLGSSNTGVCFTNNGGTGFIGFTNAANCNAF